MIQIQYGGTGYMLPSAQDLKAAHWAKELERLLARDSAAKSACLNLEVAAKRLTVHPRRSTFVNHKDGMHGPTFTADSCAGLGLVAKSRRKRSVKLR